MAKFAMQKAKSGPSPAFARMKDELQRASQKASSLRRQFNESRVPRALAGTGAAVGASVLVGAAKGAYGSEEVAGIPLDPLAGALLIGAGVATGNEWLILASAGPLSVYASQFSQDFVADWMDGGE